MHPALISLNARASASDKHIVLSEGDDPRVIEGAIMATERGLARVSLIGDPDKIDAPADIEIHDPARSDFKAEFADLLVELRKHKGMTPEKAAEAVQNRLVFAALMVRSGHADGTVGGAVETTSDVVRAALQIIGKSPDAALVSSFFAMYPPENAPEGARAMLYSDSGLVIDPTAVELASIAETSATSFTALMEEEPRIAMLSFSTLGSAQHESVAKVTDALALLRSKRSDLKADGELQFDAAFNMSVAKRKAPKSDIAGAANVMIFPNLDAGNIGYKITQRLGGYTAIGPVLQGLNKPANDLSRGCTADDVMQMIAVTVLQASAE